MKLHSLEINGFKRIRKAKVYFGDATFLIGMNNAGKSSVLSAIDALLSANPRIDSRLFYAETDETTGLANPATDTVILEAEFRNVPEDAKKWRGFKGRIFQYGPVTNDDTGLSISYRKTFHFSKNATYEMRARVLELNEKYAGCKTGADFIECGVPQEDVELVFPDIAKPLPKASLERLYDLNEIWDEQDEEVWINNPGGIPAVVMSMLPRVLLIPANASGTEIDGDKGVLHKTLGELFEEVRSLSQNYNEAQRYLNALAAEMDPIKQDSKFGAMLIELNGVLGSVFPDSKLHAKAALNDPNTAIKPTFTVELSSNVQTVVSHQGSGMVRAAAFGILRFREKWISTRQDKHARTLIVCFEEPETFLHPSAANQMRSAIYELSGGQSQIVATTHSPFMIDLSRNPRQVLNCVRHVDDNVIVHPFNVSDSYQHLDADDKAHVKMLARMDDHVARIFFTKHIVIVEGDTEEIVIKETLSRLPRDKYLKLVSDFEIIKARGKASIISFVKYLVAMQISPIVVHDRDAGVEKAEIFNQPIADAVGVSGRVVQMRECVEDEIGYEAPNKEKPYKAYLQTLKWGEQWEDVPARWRAKMKEIFGIYVD